MVVDLGKSVDVIPPKVIGDHHLESSLVMRRGLRDCVESGRGCVEPGTDCVEPGLAARLAWPSTAHLSMVMQGGKFFDWQSGNFFRMGSTVITSDTCSSRAWHSLGKRGHDLSCLSKL